MKHCLSFLCCKVLDVKQLVEDQVLSVDDVDAIINQVAAFANNHLTVQKDTSGEFTESSVHRLLGEERAAEMARLLSGLSDSDTGLAHARELLAMAGQH
jgi:DNA repair ATPase RecN